MVTYVTRAQIGLRAPTGSHSLVPSQVKNTAHHYPGMASPINAVGDAGLARVKSALRGWQAYHMDTRGWSDIAYCVAVDQVGRAYTLRGINIRSAANGGTQVNLEYGAILLILGNNEAPSAAMQATARAVMQDYRVRFAAIPRRPTWHGAIRPGGTASDPSTDCPGDLTIAAIKAGKFDAASTPVVPPTTTPPPGGLSMADAASLEQHLDTQDAIALGRYQRFEQVAGIILATERANGAALAALAEQVKSEDAVDDAALTAAIAGINANIDALEAALAKPPVEG